MKRILLIALLTIMIAPSCAWHRGLEPTVTGFQTVDDYIGRFPDAWHQIMNLNYNYHLEVYRGFLFAIASDYGWTDAHGDFVRKQERVVIYGNVDRAYPNGVANAPDGYPAKLCVVYHRKQAEQIVDQRIKDGTWCDAPWSPCDMTGGKQ